MGVFTKIILLYPPINIKSARRITNILTSLLNRVSSTGTGLIVSLLVVHNFSAALWGEYVVLLLAGNLVTTVSSWGNHEYLLRTLSANPASSSALYNNLVPRLLICTAGITVSLLVLQLPGTLILSFVVFVFASFIYRSLEVLIHWHRAYKISLIAEATAAVATCTFLLTMRALDLAALLLVAAGMIVVKIIIISGSLGLPPLRTPRLKKMVESIRGGVPFFLPTLVGFVQSRTDMYIVALAFSRGELAKYQILISMLSLVHQLGVASLAPFLKNLNRLADRAITRGAWLFLSAGTAISTVAVPVISIILANAFGLEMSFSDQLLAWLILLPLFFYSVKTYQWFRKSRYYDVALVNGLMTIITLCTTLLLIPHLGVTGALIGNACGQWFCFLIFMLRK